MRYSNHSDRDPHGNLEIGCGRGTPDVQHLVRKRGSHESEALTHGPPLVTVTDRRSAFTQLLPLTAMTKSRSSKRKRPPEERPSSISLEVISFVQQDGRFIKKRVVEKTDFDPRAPPLTFPDDDVLPAAAPPADPSSFADTSSETSPHTTSRSVSVRFLRVCFVAPTYPPPRPRFRSGFHIFRSSFMSSFAWKPLYLGTRPALHVVYLQNIIV